MNYYIELSSARNRHLMRLMQARGYKVFPLEAPWHKDEPALSAYIFSPARKFTPSELLSLQDSSVLYAGNLSKEAKECLISKGISHVNFLISEDFAVKNAALTAEGVLALCLAANQRSIYQNKILILGYGRCAKAIARLFFDLKLNYVVAAREQNQSYAPHTRIGLCELAECIGNFDIIINTIPAKIMDQSLASKLGKNTVMFEVASTSCIEDDVKNPAFSYIPAPSLPEVYNAESAAKLMMELI